ncbi:hypothetical protein VAB18032_17695 [Micromonospora maris AB-18-032]|nr:hypothetical protein VAB18032_17695 [Micromonospora maris AB-18-032]
MWQCAGRVGDVVQKRVGPLGLSRLPGVAGRGDLPGGGERRVVAEFGGSGQRGRGHRPVLVGLCCVLQLGGQRRIISVGCRGPVQGPT